MEAQLPICSGAVDTTAKTQQAAGASTVTHLVRRRKAAASDSKAGAFAHTQAKLLTVKCAKTALRRQRCSRCQVMITNSRYMKVHAMGKPAGRWCAAFAREVVLGLTIVLLPCVKGHSLQGETSLNFVTDTHKQLSITCLMV